MTILDIRVIFIGQKNCFNKIEKIKILRAQMHKRSIKSRIDFRMKYEMHHLSSEWEKEGPRNPSDARRLRMREA